MAGFVKGDGHGRNGGGRKAGTPNKVTKETRELISKFVDKHWKEFEEDFKQIKDKEKRCNIILQLLPFIAPKMASVEYKGEIPVKTFKDELDDLSGEPTRQK